MNKKTALKARIYLYDEENIIFMMMAVKANH